MRKLAALFATTLTVGGLHLPSCKTHSVHISIKTPMARRAQRNIVFKIAPIFKVDIRPMHSPLLSAHFTYWWSRLSFPNPPMNGAIARLLSLQRNVFVPRFMSDFEKARNNTAFHSLQHVFQMFARYWLTFSRLSNAAIRTISRRREPHFRHIKQLSALHTLDVLPVFSHARIIPSV